MRVAKNSAALTGPTGFRDPGWAGDEKDDSKATATSSTHDKAADVLKEIEGAPDNGIPDNIMGDAKCIAVIPLCQGGHRIRRQPW